MPKLCAYHTHTHYTIALACLDLIVRRELVNLREVARGDAGRADHAAIARGGVEEAHAAHGAVVLAHRLVEADAHPEALGQPRSLANVPAAAVDESDASAVACV
jgi:hypothetical protein